MEWPWYTTWTCGARDQASVTDSGEPKEGSQGSEERSEDRAAGEREETACFHMARWEARARPTSAAAPGRS